MAELGVTSGRVIGVARHRLYMKDVQTSKLIFRFKGVHRRSKKVLKINKKLEDVAGTDRAPAKVAKAKCLSEHPEFKKVCPYPFMKRYLREAMKSLVGKGG